MIPNPNPSYVMFFSANRNHRLILHDCSAGLPIAFLVVYNEVLRQVLSVLRTTQLMYIYLCSYREEWHYWSRRHGKVLWRYWCGTRKRLLAHFVMMIPLFYVFSPVCTWLLFISIHVTIFRKELLWVTDICWVMLLQQLLICLLILCNWKMEYVLLFAFFLTWHYSFCFFTSDIIKHLAF